MRWSDERALPEDAREAAVLARLECAPLHTPAFVTDLDSLAAEASRASEMAHAVGGRALFAMKAYSVEAGLREIAAHVDGFAASSVHEARLARRVLRPGQTVHLTAPGLRPEDLAALPALVDYAGANSLHQLRSLGAHGTSGLGLRVNPQLSVVDDERYDPCRRRSKLGMPLDELEALLAATPEALDGVEGLQIHTSCEGQDLRALVRTVQRLIERLGALWPRIRWVNLGGGYLLREARHPEALAEAAEALRAVGVQGLFIEPGTAVVRRAGWLVASVVDLFRSDGQQVAVLDTTVNHAPEVFEYQFEPWVAGSTSRGAHQYLLAGASCLAGDLFGVHGFDEPLAIGSRVVLPELGSYSLVKATQFNGIPLPTLYALRGDELTELRRYDFEDYLSICGGVR